VANGIDAQIALSIDLERCLGCRSCEAACKLEHQLGSDVARNRVLWMQYEGTPRLDFVNAVCQQCERPACVRACAHNPKAIQKDPWDGIIRIDQSLCTGCQECVKSCPYNALSFDFRHQRAEKCDLCSGRREHGMKPACVSACPGRALDYGPVDELLSRAEAGGRARRVVDHFGQNPSTIYLERTLARADAESSDFPLPQGEGQCEGEPGPQPNEPSPRPSPTAVGEGALTSPSPHGGGGRGVGSVPATPPAGAYLPVAAREGRGANQGKGGPIARLLSKLPSIAFSQESFPYEGAPRIWEADQVANGGCNLCFNSCSTRYYLKDGRVIAITGNEDDPVLQGRVCPKAQMQIQQFYSPHRLTYPMKRVGERGEGKFRRIGWDEALDEVSEKLKETRDRYGPEAVAIYTGNRTGTLTVLGAAALFGDMFGTPNREGSAPLCGTSTDVAWDLVQGSRGGGNSYTPDDAGSAQLYLIVGDNMGETRSVYFGALNDWRLKNGARMVVVDPRSSVTASKADQWLPIRPGTDMALALAMMHYAITHDLVDHAFVEKWVLGYPEIRDFILERGYTPEWAAGATDLPADTIRRLAHEYATTDRAMLHLNRGLTQHSNGVQTVRAFHMLCIITGHWGRKGAGCITISNGNPVGAKAPRDRVVRPNRPGIRKSPVAWLEAMDTGRPYPIRAMIMSTNPFVFWPEQERLRRVAKKLDLLVHLELWPNESSAWADYVFPGASSIEMGEVNRICEDRRLVWIEKLIDPPGEARPDTHFWIDLGKRFGFDDVLREEYKDSIRFWDDLMLANPRVKGMTVERLRRSPYNWARGPLPTADFEERETLFEEGSTYPGEPDGKRFPTASGKLEIWTPRLEAMFNTVGLTALPEFYSESQQLIPLPHLERKMTDADEGVPSPFWPGVNAGVARVVTPSSASPLVPEGEQGAEDGPRPLAPSPTGRRGDAEETDPPFDTELVTGRPPVPHFHSWTHFWWESQEMWPDLYIQIHPEKAATLRVSDGDRVVVETAHGSLEAVAWLYPGIRKTAAYLPIGWGERQPYNPWKGSNWLLSKEERDPASEQVNLKTNLCRIRRA